MKIMIVDDEADICFILGFELRALGHQTVMFHSAVEAQTHLMTEIPDAILCDFQMPKMNGLQLFLWLRAQGHEVPFYILTGEPTMDKRHLLDQGITDILNKPQDLMRLSSIFK